VAMTATEIGYWIGVFDQALLLLVIILVSRRCYREHLDYDKEAVKRLGKRIERSGAEYVEVACKDCKFFMDEKELRKLGWCKRYPEHYIRDYDHWCGEFKKRES
jgi:hypothetical protein